MYRVQVRLDFELECSKLVEFGTGGLCGVI